MLFMFPNSLKQKKPRKMLRKFSVLTNRGGGGGVVAAFANSDSSDEKLVLLFGN